MAVSIIGRATGVANAIGAAILLVWWLVALAGGEASYARFVDLMTSGSSGRLNLIPAVVLIGLTWSVIQHMCTGIRHLLLDTGAGYELQINKVGALVAMIVPVLVTLLIWGTILTRGSF